MVEPTTGTSFRSVRLRGVRQCGLGWASRSWQLGRQAGLTILELIAALTVAALTVALASPSLADFVASQRIKSASNEIVLSINLARAEALKRSSPVILCRTGNVDVEYASLSCAANTPEGTANQTRDWSDGWIVYVKPGYSGTGGTGGDFNHSTDGDPIALGSAMNESVTVNSDVDGDRWLAFFADGTLNEAGTVEIAVCDDRGPEHGRMITIPMIGRPHIENSPASCSP